MITLQRAYLPDGTCTLGRLKLPNGCTCLVMENPWRGNKKGASCIPEGIYTMRKRRSPMVERTSGGEFLDGWEICDAPDRTFIMIHPGNYVRDTDGCLLVGKTIGWNGELMVTHSRDVFRSLMKSLESQDEWQIDIRANTVSYP